MSETSAIRNDWTLDEVWALARLPFNDLLFRAHTIHRQHFDPNAVQVSTLVSVKTGGCPEDCAYCPQSAHYKTPVDREQLLGVDEVLAAARRAREVGATRLCMGAAWREVKDGPAFEQILEMVAQVKAQGLETCVTLGMLTAQQAQRLRAAGLDAYNHNLDSSPEFYRSIITTRTFEQRLETLKNVRAAGITVCTGGIIGMGEGVEDRCAMLVELAKLDPHPESVPINALVRVPGTPLEKMPPVDPLDLVRMVATARIMMPRARVRLSAGRTELGREAQLLCMYAGANSIFYGETLLTTPNPGPDADAELMRSAGLSAAPA